MASRRAPLHFVVEPCLDEQPVRRCPVCRRSWPVDWDYCPRCAVWLGGTEGTDRLVRLVPRVPRSCGSLGPDREAAAVLACDVRCRVASPGEAELEDGRGILAIVAERIRAYGGSPLVVEPAGLLGAWSEVGRPADDAVRLAAELLQWRKGRRTGTGAGESRVSLGIGVAGKDATRRPLGLAVRLAGLAEPDSALVSEPVYLATRERFDYRGVGPAVPRSDPLPGAVFCLVAAKPERSGSRPVGVDTVPLVGRASALAALDACREQTAGGYPVVLHVIGEPGVGKSKLLREWLRSAVRDGRLAGWLRLETDGVPYGGFPDRGWRRLVGPLRARTPETLAAAGRPTLLLVDDLHWLDAESAHALTALLATLDGLPVLGILAYRPSFAPRAPSESKRLRRRLQLSGLSEPILRTLLDERSGGSAVPLPPATRSAIVQRARGNPLYLEEAFAHLAETGEAPGNLPASLPELLTARIQWTLMRGLPALDRRHQETLLVAGALAGPERDMLLGELDRLEERLASWLDRLDVMEAAAEPLVQGFLQGLRSIDGRLALLSLFLGRQRPHRHRLAQALDRLLGSRPS